MFHGVRRIVGIVLRCIWCVNLEVESGRRAKQYVQIRSAVVPDSCAHLSNRSFRTYPGGVKHCVRFAQGMGTVIEQLPAVRRLYGDVSRVAMSSRLPRPGLHAEAACHGDLWDCA